MELSLRSDSALSKYSLESLRCRSPKLGDRYEAARGHHASRRRGGVFCFLAAHRARATASDNVTGISFLAADLGAKRLGLIRELVPSVSVGAVLINPTNPNAESVARDAQESARSLGLQFHVLNASTDQDIDTVFAGLVRQQIGVLLVSADPLFLGRRVEVAALAARYAVPVIYFAREFVAAGGLMSYGTSIGAAYRQAGLYTGKILKGVKPADLPVMQSTKFDLVINLKTAKALGITVPPMLLARADEVIE